MKNKENLREKQVNLRLTQAEYERLTRTAQEPRHRAGGVSPHGAAGRVAAGGRQKIRIAFSAGI